MHMNMLSVCVCVVSVMVCIYIIQMYGCVQMGQLLQVSSRETGVLIYVKGRIIFHTVMKNFSREFEYIHTQTYIPDISLQRRVNFPGK